MAKEKRNDEAFEITPLKAAVITVISGVERQPWKYLRRRSNNLL